MREPLDSDSSFGTDSLVTEEDEAAPPKKIFTSDDLVKLIAEALKQKTLASRLEKNSTLKISEI